MPVACVFVPRFALAVESRLRPGLGRGAAVIYDGHSVLEASAGLSEAYAGQPLRQARAIYPSATFLAANPALYREVAEEMLAALEGVAPEVEEGEPGCAYLDVRGLGGHYTDEAELARHIVQMVREATGLTGAVAIAECKFVARTAALIGVPGGVSIVPAGSEREFLSDQGVPVLPLDQQLLERLQMLALHTLGDISALPRAAVEAEFGRTGGRMWELARGIDRDPVVPRKPEAVISDRVAFERPVVTIDALILGGRQLLKRLASRLDRRTARKMRIQILIEGRLVWERLDTFREPTADEQRMGIVLKTRLSQMKVAEAVDTVAITLSGIGREAERQQKLFVETSQHIEPVAEAVEQIRSRYGRPMVWRAVEVDPCSRHPEERTVLIPYDA